jgi:hypothetical protein
VARYQSLFDDGLIPQELFDDLRRDVTVAHATEPRPRFDIGLDTRRLIERLDLLAALDPAQLDLIAKLLRPRFTVPNERIIRAGARGDAVYFICLWRGRGQTAGAACTARQRRVLWRDGIGNRSTAASGRAGVELLPAFGAAQSRL